MKNVKTPFILRKGSLLLFRSVSEPLWVDCSVLLGKTLESIVA